MATEYDCFVVNYENNAFSRYINFNFDSFGKLGDEYFALSEDGLFVLDGETDDGEDIKAKILTGEIDVSGLGVLSSVRDIFVYQSSNGTMTMNIYASDGDIETYQLFSPSERIDSSRIEDMSKGRNAVYWQFELTNDEQTKFEVDNFKLSRFIKSRF